jgi:LacI family transcriptional regulator, galactose operon repressor
MATGEQIARLAGVSRATVSRTLNGSDQVSEKTKKRIFNVIAALKEDTFRPASSPSRIIALALLDEQGLNFSRLVHSSYYFYLSILKNIDELIADANYDLFLPSGRHGRDEPIDVARANYRRTLHTNRVMGVIAVSMSSNDPRIQALYQAALPTIFVDSMFQAEHATWVRSDYLDGAYKAVEYLLSLGHRHIAFFHGDSLVTDVERILGWHQALASVGLTPDPQLTRICRWDAEDAYNATMKLLQERRDFTAIVAGSDIMALGILQALHQHHLRVPDDISLIGFDDIDLCERADPPLTTIHQDTRLISQGAVSGLLQMLETKETPPPVVVPTKLVIRGSTRSIDPV